MKTVWIWMSLALGGALWAPGLRAVEARPAPDPVAPSHGKGLDRGSEEVCATGCAAATSTTSDLGAPEFQDLLQRFVAGGTIAQVAPPLSQDPSSPAALALDTLLFHGDDSRAHLAAGRAAGFPREHVAMLERELDRRHALLSVRLVDAAGEERLRLKPTRVPLGEKQHLLAEDTTDLQAPEVSGTVRRVGLHHLWTRL